MKFNRLRTLKFSIRKQEKAREGDLFSNQIIPFTDPFIGGERL